MKYSVLLSLVTLAIGLTVCGTQRAIWAADREAKTTKPIETRVYKVADLPVWTSEKKYDPAVLMRLIQASVSPSDWAPKRGESKMAPYPQNASLIISTRPENHDKIVDLLESMRPRK